MDKIYLSAQTTITITILIGLLFIGLGYLNKKKKYLIIKIILSVIEMKIRFH